MNAPHLKNEKQQGQYEEYIARINRVIDHIEKHIETDLSLENLAQVANFSRFHFHRIFRAMMGETLNRFILRIRLEKAAAQLIATPKKSITEIALDCGFSGSATFARAFKEAFAMSASSWRLKGNESNRKICKQDGKKSQIIGNIRKDIQVCTGYLDHETTTFKWRIQMKDKSQIQVKVEDVPEFCVAYIRHIGPYKGDSQLFDELFGKLMKWAGPRGLLRFPETQILSIYHDDPKITDSDKLRTSVCISVPADTPVEGEIGKMTVAGGKYAKARFELTDSSGYEEAWDTVYGVWLPESGYQPDDGPSYELYLNDPKNDPQGKHIVDICIPVKPL